MLKILLLLWGVIIYGSALPAPQDMETSALLLAGQMKEVMDNGAAARNSKDIEFMGAKMGAGFEVGFGDAVKPPARHRRAIEQLLPQLLPEQSLLAISNALKRSKRENSVSSSSESSGSESDEQ